MERDNKILLDIAKSAFNEYMLFMKKYCETSSYHEDCWTEEFYTLNKKVEEFIDDVELNTK
jgi:hypothetical protein